VSVLPSGFKRSREEEEAKDGVGFDSQ